MWGIYRQKILPVCQQCKRTITMDYCFQTGNDKEREERCPDTLICENCRDRAIRKFGETYLADVLENWFDERMVSTDEYSYEADIIETRLADLWA